MKYVRLFNENGYGLNIGFLLSQLFGLIYLDRFDHFCKRRLKLKHYIRYVDDVVIIGYSKEELYKIKAEIERYLLINLHLKLSKWKINKVKKGINFVGYRTWRSTKFIRKYSLHKFNRFLIRREYKRLCSILAHAKNTSSYKYLIGRVKEELSPIEYQHLNRRTRNDLQLQDL